MRPIHHGRAGSLAPVLGLLVIIIVFVSAGLGVIALAMRTGRTAGPRTRKGARRKRRLALGGAAIMALAFGLGIPALVMTYNASSQSKGAPGGVKLTASQQHGRQVFAKNCSTCHTLAAANAVGKVGPSLDAIIPPIPEKKARIAFVDDAVANGRARGMGQMPKGLIDGTDQQEVSDFIATAAGR